MIMVWAPVNNFNWMIELWLRWDTVSPSYGKCTLDLVIVSKVDQPALSKMPGVYHESKNPYIRKIVFFG